MRRGSALCSATQRQQTPRGVGGGLSIPPHPQGVSDAVPARSITLRLPQGGGGGLHPGHRHKTSRKSPLSLQLGTDLSNRHRAPSASRVCRCFSSCKGEGHRIKSRNKPLGARLAACQPGTALGHGLPDPQLASTHPALGLVKVIGVLCYHTTTPLLALPREVLWGWIALEESWTILVGCLTSLNRRNLP